MYFPSPRSSQDQIMIFPSSWNGKAGKFAFLEAIRIIAVFSPFLKDSICVFILTPGQPPDSLSSVKI